MSEQDNEPLSAVAWCLVALTFGALGCAGGWFARDYQARHEKADNRVTLTYASHDWNELIGHLHEMPPDLVALVGYVGDDGDIHALSQSDLQCAALYDMHAMPLPVAVNGTWSGQLKACASLRTEPAP